MDIERIDRTGYIYILYNEVYNYYGENVFKVGMSNDVSKRARAYTTSYIKPVEIRYISELCKNCQLAEHIVFCKLSDFRCVSNREFFKCVIDHIIKIIDETIDNINKGIIETIETQQKEKPQIKGDNEEMKHDIISNIINDLGFNTDNYRLDEHKFNEAMAYIFIDGALKDLQYIKKLFKIDKCIINNLVKGCSNKAKLGFLNSILSSYEKKIKADPRRIKGKVNKMNSYVLIDFME